VTETNVFQLCQPGTFADPLTEVLRNGARALLSQVVEAEVAAFHWAQNAKQWAHPVRLGIPTRRYSRCTSRRMATITSFRSSSARRTSRLGRGEKQKSVADDLASRATSRRHVVQVDEDTSSQRRNARAWMLLRRVRNKQTRHGLWASLRANDRSLTSLGADVVGAV
jgi:hypothetical protein